MVRIQAANGCHIVAAHFLLDVSGDNNVQPIQVSCDEQKTNFVVLFNGEIFNYRQISESAKNDTDLFASILKNKGSVPFDSLDGEYVVVVFDIDKNFVTVATDQFMTKPICVGWSDDKKMFGLASYPSALLAIGANNVAYATPNSVVSYNLNEPESWTLPSCLPSAADLTINYNIEQFINSYDRWEQAFLSSVRKRATHGSLPIFVPLSSGYDSGAICLALNILKIPYNTITIDSEEDSEIIRERIRVNTSPSSFCKEHVSIDALSSSECSDIRVQINKQCENFKFLHSDQTLLDDDGALGGFKVAQIAREKGWLVGISGCGADEIVSDYGHNGKKFYDHSEFGGLFPEDLEGFFPWKKFYGDSMRSYLFKDELIFGVFGIEGRYPFLDPFLTQEFLSLSGALKNAEYKAPIANFLRKHGYPFEAGIKRGFTPYNKYDYSASSIKSESFLKKVYRRMFS